jgi:hypothetical protein
MTEEDLTKLVSALRAAILKDSPESYYDCDGDGDEIMIDGCFNAQNVVKELVNCMIEMGWTAARECLPS